MATAAIALDSLGLPFLDTKSDKFVQDPFSLITELRRDDPEGTRVLRTPWGVEVVSYAAGRPMLADKRIKNFDLAHYESLGAGPLMMEYVLNGHLTAMQGQQHLVHRRLETPVLTPGVVTDEQRALYREIANELVDRFHQRGEVELVSAFSHAYPIEVLCRSIGIPVEDIPLFQHVTLEVANINAIPLEPVVPRIESALASLVDYVSDLIDRRSSDRREDGVNIFVNYVEDGRMTREQVVWSLTGLMQAAHFTTRNQTSSVVRALLENDLWDAVTEDRSLIPAVVEETQRYYPVIVGIPRWAGEPGIVIEGVELPEGAPVRWNTLCAGRDPEMFDEPNRFDPSRPTDTRRVPFGFGIHKCLGHSMARTDMEIAIEVLTERLGSPRIAEPLEMAMTGAMWGPARLPMTFEPRSAQ
jgi:cytochrome P450